MGCWQEQAGVGAGPRLGRGPAGSGPALDEGDAPW
jgi:hypothetical protein